MGKVFKRGKSGNINITGSAGSSSYILKASHKDFWKSIEPGVRPLVRSIVEGGYDTCSSCEGHVYANGRKTPRVIEIIVDRSVLEDWIVAIATINLRHRLTLKWEWEANPTCFYAASRQYIYPFTLRIILGMPGDADLDRRTGLLVQLFRRGAFPAPA